MKTPTNKPSKVPFRRSREAIIIDTLLFPVGFVWSLLMQGLPGTWKELKNYRRDLVRRWNGASWFFGETK